jgi:uncharacterized protein (DUF58 family)
VNAVSRPVPTLRGWVVGAAGVVLLVAAGWAGRVDLLFGGLLLTIAPLAAMAAVALDRPWLSVARTYSPDTVEVGEEVQVRLDVRNQSGRATASMSWVDTVPAGFARLAFRALPSLASGQSVTLRYSERAARRGAYLLGPLTVARTDPFGLARGGYGVGESKVLLVTPRVRALAGSGDDEARGEGTDPELVRHSIPSTDEVIPRDYRAGDPLRRVQWRATARAGRLMVRQEEQLSNPEAWLLLDTLRAHAGGAEPFERAVELVASIGSHLLDVGYQLGVHETGERQLAGSYELPGGDQLLVGQLAAIEQVREPGGDIAGRFAASLRATRSGVPVFLILVDGDPQLAAEFAPLRRYAAPAIAFLMTSSAAAARELLERAGWVCVEADGRTDAAAAWSLAMQAQQPAGGPRLAGAADVRP